ncbi:MBL fold metallo-hydrolase [Actinophytocola oryzae]|uniref:Glyoxylase-like metal-dependent hydrolase (Beta-lactamase superfamily II) n=1 Tax=Actinophytocola oryzae TaxID=502181 RepID=A0A4R7W440_9PSEU|nr:MBL fold metallo-hydrolase [Actinophytocola oryzae]TDV57334.1 glyoxylase-like metal-dependent hydrolase (beta-lactamase superfamily II) [Actinophytocola oryzae]
MLIGDIDVHPVADGTFRASPAYFGEHATPDGHEDLFTRDGMAWLPIGCFLVRTGERTVLVDAGLGPAVRDSGPRRLLVGGQLLVGLRAAGVTPPDVTDVVCTHLHADHCGWLYDLDAAPVFPNATVWFGAHDWDHFVTDPDVWMFDHIRHGLREAAGRLRLVAGDTTVAPGITLMMTPGHTPGHLSVVVSSRGRRALLLGDAIVCPVQLDEPTWQSIGDVDPELAGRVRERLWRELEDGVTFGAGAHFPELRFGRVLAGQGRRWLT